MSLYPFNPRQLPREPHPAWRFAERHHPWPLAIFFLSAVITMGWLLNSLTVQ